MNLVNAVLHLFQQVQPAPRDPGDHVAPVLATTLPDDQLGLFQAIQKPGNVRDLSHQSFPDFAPAQTRRLRPAQNPQNVVLRCRNPVRLQGSLEGVLQQRRRALDAEVCLLFEALERARLFQFCL